MKASLLGLCLLVVTAQGACAPAGNVARAAPIPANAEQEVLQLSRRKWLWMADRNVDSLSALFHPEAVFVHMGGSWGRDQEINIIRSGGIHYKHAEVFEASARLAGSTAIVPQAGGTEAHPRQPPIPMTILRTSLIAALLCVAAPGLTACGCAQAQSPSQAGPWKVPPGFHVEVFADSVENAREMALGAQGTVFVGSRTGDKVHAVIDSDGDHKADRVLVIARGLDQPNGVAIRNGALYVATASKILRFDDIESHLDSPPAPVVVRDSLPNPSAGHTWKTIAFGPDGLLYMSVGAPCNVCLPPPMVSAILRMKPDGSDLEVFADGIRNSVGFDWSPTTHELWFTDNGRDALGDTIPNDELNVAWKPGLNFGFPYCHQGDVPDPQFGAQRACSATEPPVLKLGAHVAALGFTFYTGTMFPASYSNAVIVAQHGSWNRSVPSGYRVMVAHTDGRRVTRYESFLDGGFLPNRDSGAPGGFAAGRAAAGRPVDVLQMPDGSVLISDDTGNRILRVSYQR